MNKFKELRNKYPNFIYEKYQIEENELDYVITYYFKIENLIEFTPKLKINKNIMKKNDKMSEYIIFNIGMIELISYWKSTCSKNVIINAGYLDENQINWFKKLYFLGLGELFYKNNINTTIEEFMSIKCTKEKEEIFVENKIKNGNLIPIGGGKDSCVTLEILKKYKDENTCFMINTKDEMINCITIAGYENFMSVKRILDKKILELNEQGFINGHTPFSSLVAFISYLIAYETDKENIILSNESSANEETIIGTNINHQYSKTYEFEKDFNNYIEKYFIKEIKYFSILRPLKEIQIAYIFSKYEKYHQVFRSCNMGSKNKDWSWCCNCPKCLFIYIILSPFLSKEKLINIFKEDLYEKETLLEDFKQLIGKTETKPFECVGSIEEVIYSLEKVIENNKEELPYLLRYYKENKNEEIINKNILKELNNEHNLNEKFLNLLKKEVDINV